MDDQLKQSALDFHEFPVPGKIRIPDQTAGDPARSGAGLLAAWLLRARNRKDPLAAYKYTARGNGGRYL